VAGKISLFQGTAEVVFALQTDALAAIKRYNNVQLDGKPLKIELVGDNVITPVPVLVTTTTNLAKPKMSLEGTTLLVIIQTWNQLLSCIHLFLLGGKGN
jgi:RNA recognition motif-containing protein